MSTLDPQIAGSMDEATLRKNRQLKLLSKYHLNKAEISLNNHTVWWPALADEDSRQHLRESMKAYLKGPRRKEVQRIINPRLCPFCRVFFDKWVLVAETLWKYNDTWSPEVFRPQKALRTIHHSNVYDLTISASHCALCALFLGVIRLNKKLNSQAPSEFRVTETPMGENLEGGMILRYDYWFSRWELSLSPYHRDYTLISWPSKIPKTAIEHPPSSMPQYQGNFNLRSIVSHDIDPNSMDLPLRWLEECRTNHNDCRSTEKKKPPTRLIKIDDDIIRLYIPREEKEDCSIYATLSHCWGSLDFLRLSRDNIDRFLNQIPIEALTKTFSDAIEIARALGFAYIWIDSLCIIQNDPEDWRRESSLMATVYGSSGLNICATAAEDGSVGCLFERDPIYAQGIAVKTEINGTVETYKLGNKDVAAELSSNMGAPLAKRAWVLQEQMLTTRNLHCGTSQFFWECKTKKSCQTFSEMEQILPERMRPSIQHSINNWGSIIEKYSAKELTNEGDRLIALSGIAQRIHEQTGDQYFAGIWWKHIERQLCWSRIKPRTSSPSKHSMPSWSWAANCERGIHQPDNPGLPEKETLLYVRDVHVELDGQDPFGGVSSGTLTISSNLLVPGTIQQRSGNEFDCKFLTAIIKIGHTGFHCDVSWDSNLEETDDQVFFLLMVDRGPYGMTGLILSRTDTAVNGEYRRVGIFDSYNDSLAIFGQEFEKLEVMSSEIMRKEDYCSVQMDERGKKWYTITII
ncbi:hypothetical protein NHQ30_010060 [Ciborinia camelliae]|nr:hypothetical protein NHQ30_010060 [Ciborinia camelliae]